MNRDEGMIKLKELREKQVKIAEELLAVDLETNVDCFIFTVLHRSISLTKGFELLIQHNNYETAGMLVRAQLDSIIRINAPRYAKNSEEFFGCFYSGVNVGSIESQDTSKNEHPKLLQDWHLKERLVKDFPAEFSWLKDIYSEMSDYVHLSPKHIASARREAAEENEDGTKNVYYNVSDESLCIPEERYIDLIDKFLSVSAKLIDYFEASLKGKLLRKSKENNAKNH